MKEKSKKTKKERQRKKGKERKKERQRKKDKERKTKKERTRTNKRKKKKKTKNINIITSPMNANKVRVTTAQPCKMSEVIFSLKKMNCY